MGRLRHLPNPDLISLPYILVHSLVTSGRQEPPSESVLELEVQFDLSSSKKCAKFGFLSLLGHFSFSPNIGHLTFNFIDIIKPHIIVTARLTT